MGRRIAEQACPRETLAQSYTQFMERHEATTIKTEAEIVAGWQSEHKRLDLRPFHSGFVK
jgi:hypothetical protein